MAYETIRKSIVNRRKYRLMRFGLVCSVDNDIFTMIHYRTPILRVHLGEKRILSYGGYSRTDASYINYALQLIGLEGFRCRHSRRLNKIWIEDSEGNIYDLDMKVLDKEEVRRKDKMFEARVRKALKVWERRIKRGEVAGRIDETTVRPKRIRSSEDEGVFYERLGRDLEPIEAYVLPQGSLDESCWLNQFRGLKACYECEYLGREECGGGYKFLYQVLEFYGYRFPEIFLCEYQKSDTGKIVIKSSIRKVKENWKHIKRALAKFYRYSLRNKFI